MSRLWRGTFGAALIVTVLTLRVGSAPPTATKERPLVGRNEKDEPFEFVIEGATKKGIRKVQTVDIGGVEMKFVRIKAGTFRMGSPKEEKGRGDDEDQHPVEITKDFYMGMFPVTQSQYKAVTSKTPSYFKGDRLPVETVSWEDADQFCELLTKKLKRSVVLPSEAQWEYACRAGTTTPFHFGSRLNGDLANCDGGYPYGTSGKDAKATSKETPVSVGSYPANPWGLYDMHGNVCQWCRDSYGPYDKVEGKKDPVQLPEQSDNLFVMRGGSFMAPAKDCRAACRLCTRSTSRGNLIGFRVCFGSD